MSPACGKMIIGARRLLTWSLRATRGRAGTRVVICCTGIPTVANEHYVVMTVECSHCKTKQKVHVAARPGFGQMGEQAIPCINCSKYFIVSVAVKIIRGPFPA